MEFNDTLTVVNPHILAADLKYRDILWFFCITPRSPCSLSFTPPLIVYYFHPGATFAFFICVYSLRTLELPRKVFNLCPLGSH